VETSGAAVGPAEATELTVELTAPLIDAEAEEAAELTEPLEDEAADETDEAEEEAMEVVN
jgi:hypothetical protein